MVRDRAGVQWVVQRRFAPWRRVIQPAALPFGSYRTYRVRRSSVPAEPRGADAISGDVDKPSRFARATGWRPHGWSWLLVPLIAVALVICLVPILIVGYLAEIAEAALMVLRILAWLVLLPFAAVEALAQGLIGSVLWLGRAVRLARSRVDVLGGPADRLLSSTVLLVPGWGAAGRLRLALRQARQQAPTPFDPAAEPALAGPVAVARHVSVWTAPPLGYR